MTQPSYKPSRFIRGHNDHTKTRPPINDLDLMWLAGLIEGEGCFDAPRRKRSSGGEYRGASISVGMTDEDVIARVASLVGAKSYSTRPASGRMRKPLYVVVVAEPYALVLMQRLRPLMGQRRREKIDEVCRLGARLRTSTAWLETAR